MRTCEGRPHLVHLHGAREHSITDPVEMFYVSRATAYRILGRDLGHEPHPVEPEMINS